MNMEGIPGRCVPESSFLPPRGRSVFADRERPPQAVYEYKFFEVWSSQLNEGRTNIGELNRLLAQGWEPVRETVANPVPQAVASNWLVLLRKPKG